MGTTSLHTNFCIGFALTTGEVKEDFLWILEQVTSLAESVSIPPPHNIISDFCHAFKNAASINYPDAQQQLCIWHINKNVAFHMKKKWLGNDEDPDNSEDDDEGNIPPGPQAPGPNLGNDDQAAQAAEEVYEQLRDQFNSRVEEAERVASRLIQSDDTDQANQDVPTPRQGQRCWPDTQVGFMDAWHSVCMQQTEELFFARWKLLVKEFSHQIPLLTYLQKHHIPWRAQWARFATTTYRNYGIYSSSRVESTHAELKRLLTTPLSGLFELYRTVKQLVCTKRSKYLLQHRKEDTIAYVSMENTAMVKPLSRTIGRVALREVHSQYVQAKAEKSSQQRRTHCSGRFRLQWGLPCKHEILDLLETDGGRLSLDHVESHWHLVEPMVRIGQTVSPLYPLVIQLLLIRLDNSHTQRLSEPSDRKRIRELFPADDDARGHGTPRRTFRKNTPLREYPQKIQPRASHPTMSSAPISFARQQTNDVEVRLEEHHPPAEAGRVAGEWRKAEVEGGLPEGGPTEVNEEEGVLAEGKEEEGVWAEAGGAQLTTGLVAARPGLATATMA